MRISRKKLCLFLGVGILVAIGFSFRFVVSKPKYELSICAIFRDEAPYLKEWIEFHKMQGVEHFFLYNNNSSDEYQKILEPYILSKKVTLVEWPYTYETVYAGNADAWLSIQKGAYTDCLKRYGKKTKWLAAIDIDEFLFCPTGKLLPLFLKGYESYGGLCVNWLLFGTSHLDSLEPNTLLIEHLTRCAPLEDQRNHEVKSIVQTKYAIRAKSAHEFKFKKRFFAVNPLGDRIRSLFSPRVSFDQIRINHYWTRTEDYFSQKKIASRNRRRAYEDEAYLRQRCVNYNTNQDNAILQFVVPLKRQIFPDLASLQLEQNQ